jgi:hypothetical protein
MNSLFGKFIAIDINPNLPALENDPWLRGRVRRKPVAKLRAGGQKHHRRLKFLG